MSCAKRLPLSALLLAIHSRRSAVSLFLVCNGTTITSRYHARTIVCNRHATDYASFGALQPDAAGPAAVELSARTLLRSLSGMEEAEELVAWTMIEYNTYFGGLLAEAASAGGARGLIRQQAVSGTAAEYAFARAGEFLRHESLGRANYAHCSSPIRRYADLHNQHVLFGSFVEGAGVGAVDEPRLRAVNERVGALAHYHARVDMMELAYRCREVQHAPVFAWGREDIGKG